MLQRERYFLRSRPGGLRAAALVFACVGILGAAWAPAGPPTDSAAPALQVLARQFPTGTNLRRTAHFLVVYDTDHHWAEGRARLLEQAYSRFMRQMQAAGFDPRPPGEPLVAVCFRRHRDYLAYARRTESTNLEGSGGYYSPATNRIVLYHGDTSPDLAPMRALVRQRRESIEGSGGPRTGALQDLDLVSRRYRARAGRNNIAHTLHEAAHQLAFNSGVHPPGQALPFWLTEGLATAFETTNPAVPFGPGEVNRARLRDLQAWTRGGRSLDLAELVTVLDPPAGTAEERAALYARSWGLFHFLFRRHRPALRVYMRAGGAAASPEQIRRRFESAFGPVEQVEAQWVRFLGGLRH